MSVESWFVRSADGMEHRQAILDGRVVPAGRCGDPAVMWAEHSQLVEAGCLDPDEPTPWSHYVHQQVNADVAAMTPAERDAYRTALDLAPDAAAEGTTPR